MANNKNKKRLGVAAAALAMVVGVGATAGTTLAKYISSVEVTSQTATVAKWGYTLTADASNLFGKEYGNIESDENEPGTLATTKAENSGVVVKADTSNTFNVVAPGTTGSMTLTINGTAEVNAYLIIDLDYLSNDHFKTIKLSKGEDDAYYPIKWAATIGDTSGTVTTTSWSGENEDGEYDEENAVTTADNLAKIIEAALDTEASKPSGGKFTFPNGYSYKKGDTVKADGSKITVKLPANTTISQFVLTISWKWDFQTLKAAADEEEETDATYFDAEDTLLGYLSAGKSYDDIKDLEELKSLLSGGQTDYTAYATSSNSEKTIEFALRAMFVQTQDDFSASED